MLTIRLQKLVVAIGLGIGMGSCVLSDRPLIVDAKPLLGGRTSAILFRDFKEGAGYIAQPSIFYWKDGFYVRSGKAGEPVVKFTVEPLAGDDFIVERSQEDKADGQGAFTYLLGRKVAAGGYLGVPLADDALPTTDRDKICNNAPVRLFCRVSNHDQMLLIAKATAARALHDPWLVVLTREEEAKPPGAAR